MSKGSKQRPMLISDSQMQDNWDMIFSKHSVYIWPHGDWCELDELESMSHLSDDFTKLTLSSAHYEDLLHGNFDPQELL